MTESQHHFPLRRTLSWQLILSVHTTASKTVSHSHDEDRIRRTVSNSVHLSSPSTRDQTRPRRVKTFLLFFGKKINNTTLTVAKSTRVSITKDELSADEIISKINYIKFDLIIIIYIIDLELSQSQRCAFKSQWWIKNGSTSLGRRVVSRRIRIKRYTMKLLQPSDGFLQILNIHIFQEKLLFSKRCVKNDWHRSRIQKALRE